MADRSPAPRAADDGPRGPEGAGLARPSEAERIAQGMRDTADRPAAGAAGTAGEPTGPAGPMEDDPKIRRIQELADWLDTKFTIPVINWPIGLDGILGLIPGVGDTLTAGLSSYLIYEAYQSGARSSTLARMGWNVGVDWMLGTIPLVGDIFDVAHKANAKNARLLLEELRRNQTEMRARAAERHTEGPTGS